MQTKYYTIESKSINIHTIQESYDDLKRQRNYYKGVAMKLNNTIDTAKFWIYITIALLMSALDFDKLLELF